MDYDLVVPDFHDRDGTIDLLNVISQKKEEECVTYTLNRYNTYISILNTGTYKEAVYYEKKKENAYSSSSDVEKGKGRRKKKANQKYLNRDHSVTPPPCMPCESGKTISRLNFILFHPTLFSVCRSRV